MTNVSEAARALAKRSIAARRLKWGEEGFRERMRTWANWAGVPREEREARCKLIL